MVYLGVQRQFGTTPRNEDLMLWELLEEVGDLVLQIKVVGLRGHVSKVVTAFTKSRNLAFGSFLLQGVQRMRRANNLLLGWGLGLDRSLLLLGHRFSRGHRSLSCCLIRVVMYNCS